MQYKRPWLIRPGFSLGKLREAIKKDMMNDFPLYLILPM